MSFVLLLHKNLAFFENKERTDGETHSKHKPARVVAHTFNYLGDVIMPGDDNKEDAKLAEKWTFTTQHTQLRRHIGIALTPIHQFKLGLILTEPRLVNIHNLQQHLD